MAKSKYEETHRAEVQLDPTNKVVALISRNTSNNVIKMDIRHWWLPEGATDFVPTSKGVNIPIDKVQPLLDAMAEWTTPKEPVAE